MSGVIHVWRIGLIGPYPDLFHPVGDAPSAEGSPTLCPAWLTTRCEAHAEGLRPIAPQPGGDIHVMELVVEGGRQTLRRRLAQEGH